MTPRTVHIGIVLYNSLLDLPQLFDSIGKQTYAPLRITVLDNASEDGSADWVEQHIQHIPSARCLRASANLGFGRGHNTILQTRQPDEDYLALNPDVQLTPDCIKALVEATQNKTFAWATGKLLLSTSTAPTVYSTGHALERGGYTFNIGNGLLDEGQFDAPREVFGASGALALYTADFLEAMTTNGSLFDEAMFMYGEDTDLDWRARLHGLHCIYTPTAVAFHRGSRPTAALRAEALANRYLSVLKNAFIVDLLTYNLPLTTLHLGLRLVLTPRAGLQITRKLLRNSISTCRKRVRPHVSRQEVIGWFHWSQAQPTGQPRSVRQRLTAFRHSHGERSARISAV